MKQVIQSCKTGEVAEAKTGFVIYLGADQLAEALVKLLDDTQLRNEMGENGYRLVLERFTWGKIADKMIRVYKDIIRNH